MFMILSFSILQLLLYIYSIGESRVLLLLFHRRVVLTTVTMSRTVVALAVQLVTAASLLWLWVLHELIE